MGWFDKIFRSEAYHAKEWAEACKQKDAECGRCKKGHWCTKVIEVDQWDKNGNCKHFEDGPQDLTPPWEGEGHDNILN